MEAQWDKVFEGTYHYLQDGKSYSEENFHLEQSPQSLNYRYRTEILSRVETGEFFKMNITHEVNKFYHPLNTAVERSLGNKFSRETFTIDTHNQLLKYAFEGEDGTHAAERPFGGKHQMVLPCFTTAGLFTLTRKIDATARTAVIFVTSPNEWSYVGPPEDKILYVELKSHNNDDFTVGGVPVPASKYEIFESDSLDAATPATAHLMVSKHYGLPYQMIDVCGIQMVVKRMKKNRQEPEKIF